MDIDGKAAVVTGGGSGIGLALCAALTAAGARVVVGDLDEDAARDAVARLVAARGSAVAVRADAGRTDDIATMVSTAEQEFGQVDIYTANAGIMGTTGLGADEDWARILEMNLGAHVLSRTD